jgi:hypothetical protein
MEFNKVIPLFDSSNIKKSGGLLLRAFHLTYPLEPYYAKGNLFLNKGF